MQSVCPKLGLRTGMCGAVQDFSEQWRELSVARECIHYAPVPWSPKHFKNDNLELSFYNPFLDGGGSRTGAGRRVPH